MSKYHVIYELVQWHYTKYIEAIFKSGIRKVRKVRKSFNWAQIGAQLMLKRVLSNSSNNPVWFLDNFLLHTVTLTMQRTLRIILLHGDVKLIVIVILIFPVITQVSQRTSAFYNPALENSKLQNFVNFSVDRGSSYSSLPSCAETYILPKFCNNVRKRRLCKVSTMAPDQELSHFLSSSHHHCHHHHRHHRHHHCLPTC